MHQRRCDRAGRHRRALVHRVYRTRLEGVGRAVDKPLYPETPGVCRARRAVRDRPPAGRVAPVRLVPILVPRDRAAAVEDRRPRQQHLTVTRRGGQVLQRGGGRGPDGVAGGEMLRRIGGNRPVLALAGAGRRATGHAGEPGENRLLDRLLNLPRAAADAGRGRHGGLVRDRARALRVHRPHLESVPPLVGQGLRGKTPRVRPARRAVRDRGPAGRVAPVRLVPIFVPRDGAAAAIDRSIPRQLRPAVTGRRGQVRGRRRGPHDRPVHLVTGGAVHPVVREGGSETARHAVDGSAALNVPVPIAALRQCVAADGNAVPIAVVFLHDVPEHQPCRAAAPVIRGAAPRGGLADPQGRPRAAGHRHRLVEGHRHLDRLAPAVGVGHTTGRP